MVAVDGSLLLAATSEKPIVNSLLEPDVHRQAVAVTLLLRPQARRRALGDQQGRAADGHGVEDVVAGCSRERSRLPGESVTRQQAEAQVIGWLSRVFLSVLPI